MFAWYWTVEGDRVAWDGQPPPTADGRVWGFYFAFGSDLGPQADVACARLGETLNRQAPGWRLTGRVPYTYEPRARKERPRRCELFCFERTDGLARGN